MVPPRGVAEEAGPAQSGRAIVRLAKRIGADPADREASFAAVTETAAALLSVDRVGIWLFDDAHTRIECADLYERMSERHASDFALEAAQYPNYFRSLEQERILAATDARSDPRTAEFTDSYLRPHGIGAMLDAPIRVGGRMVGVICHEAVGPPREWTTDEQALAASMGDFVSLAIESSERARAQQERSIMSNRIARARKMEALGRLAGSIAHDFNNLLMGIQGSLDLVRHAREHDRVDAALLDEELAHMNQAVGRASELTRQLLGFSKQELVNARVIRPTGTLMDLRETLTSMLGDSIQLDVQASEEAPAVKFDPDALRHVVLHLASNARDAMPEGGELQIVMRGADAPHAPEWLELELTDSGKGIPPEVLPLIFEPFFSTKLVGTGWGLGLTTVQRLVESAGGHIFVRSKPDQGTVFRIRLPACSEDSDEPPPIETES